MLGSDAMRVRARQVGLIVAVMMVCVLSLTTTEAHAQGNAGKQLNSLFSEYWEWVMATNPGFATFLGDGRYNDRLTDQSAAAILKRRAEADEFLRRATAIDPAGLEAQERLSRAVFIRDLTKSKELQRFYGALALTSAHPVNQRFGPQFGLPELVRSTRFTSMADYEGYLKRLAAIPMFLEQTTEMLKTGATNGWTPPRVTVQDVPVQIGAQIVSDPTKSAFFAPFNKFPADIPAPARERLRAAGEAVIRDKVVPAYASFRTYFETEYLPRTRTDIAASSLPGGAPYYDALLRDLTTTDLTAQQIHDTGLAEVKRIEAEMDAVMRESGFKGTRAEFVKFLWSDPKFFWASPGEMLAGLRDMSKRADAEMPKLFRELPRQPYGIRAMPPERGRAAESYTPGAADGSRAGYFEANTNNLKGRPKWQMPTVVLHEAAPGHHTQNARAQEMAGVPTFRRHSWKAAYSEGWALYAERLGYEMAMYDDPYDRYGNLSGELLRATRMVVDTGIHAKGWSREQAVEYMKQHTTEDDAFIVSEVDRYIVWPGQATTYKVGQLKILELRARARSALGDSFDLRAFHNVIIDSGPLPLSVVEENVDLWITAQKVGARSSKVSPGL